ncbi:MAG: DNA-3-methyladenine glycosylase [Chloroflexota bacterium]|nr:DNA-3-methyladenine glycosylase [Chloroflexota bacterium]
MTEPASPLATLYADLWDDARATWAARDPVLYAVTGPSPVPRPLTPLPTPFAALANAVTHQQVSMAAGRAIAARTVEAAGGAWDPAAILERSEETLRAAGLSRGKVRTIRALAEVAVAGDLEALDQAPDDAIISRLVALPGIGVWTAKMFLIFHLQRPDVFAGEDLGLRMGIRLLEGLAEPLNAVQAQQRAELWTPYRSVASLVLWDLVHQHRAAARAMPPLPRPRSRGGAQATEG